MDASDNQFEIMNRSKTFFVSKKLLCSTIPYFEKMFCCDLLESKENKVTLDLDESGFNNIISFVYSNIFVLNMENVLQTYDCCEYLMIEELQRECSDFFYTHFNTEFLPTVLQAINERSKLITPRMINCFICRHFLKISNTKAFLDFPFDIIEYILKLDLVVDSEYQVFDAIKRWILFDKDGGRNEHLNKLLKLIRWCHTNVNDLMKIKEDKLFENQQDLHEIIAPVSGCKHDCAAKRVPTNFPLIIYEINEATIEISVLDGPSFCFPCGQFTLNESLLTNLITDEHVTDILYDSGRKGIRVDWQSKMFKHLNMVGTDDSYYGQIYRYIMFGFIKSSTTSDLDWFLPQAIEETDLSAVKFQNVLLDSGGIFIGIGSINPEKEYVYLTAPLKHKSGFYTEYDHHPSYHVCIIKDQIYIIKMDLEMLKVDLEAKELQKSTLIKEFEFDDVQLFSYRDKLMLGHKSKQMIYSYNQTLQNWSLMCQLKTPKQLIAISSTYSSPKDMEMIYRVK